MLKVESVSLPASTKRVAILQSNYIPWKGYFDLIATVDEFIVYDDMQYTRRDWRNRNKIKTPQGSQWLSIPVKAKGNYFQAIKDMEIDGEDWAKQHWRALELNYKRAPFFQWLADELAPYYLSRTWTHLSELNVALIRLICGLLGITTPLRFSGEFALEGEKTARLVSICRQTGATHYLSGPAAQDYIQPHLFEDQNIVLEWFDYSGYPEYPQLWGPFDHYLSILDLLFNCGPEALRYMQKGIPAHA